MKIEEIPPIENVEIEVKIAYGKINQLVDLVNSQQEAIEGLQDHVDHEARHVSEPADNLADRIEKLECNIGELEKVITRDIVRVATEDIISTLSDTPDGRLETVSKARYGEKLGIYDTHRTVTLRIPKGMSIVEAIEEAYQDTIIHTDTDLQKALDELGEPNE